MRCPTYGLHTWRGRLESSCMVSIFPSWGKKGDRHRSEAEPVPVPLRAKADAGGRRRSDDRRRTGRQLSLNGARGIS